MTWLGFGWHQRPKPPTSKQLADGMSPYLTWCIEKFGPDRCMFESNFPVDRASFSYTAVWSAFKRFTSGFSAVERSDLFKDTAMRVYRLG
jgi:predicted TIM-barrel fold metal-dependent hydrolase